jgi:hypothetical protein
MISVFIPPSAGHCHKTDMNKLAERIAATAQILRRKASLTKDANKFERILTQSI